MVSETNADKLISNAFHKSVTEKRLTKLKPGIGTRYLYDKPLIEYLNEDEQPQFIFVARNTTPTFSGSEPVSWSGISPTGMAMHMVTDTRWLIVVGVKKGDKVLEIELSDILDVDYSTGITKHKISLRTDHNNIEIPIANKHNSEEIEDAVDFIRSHKSAESSTAELVNRAQDDSVTKNVLTRLEQDGWGNPDYLKDKPLIEYLDTDEQPHVILSTNIPPEFSDSYSIDWTKTKGYMTLFMATESQLLIVQGHKTGDMSISISYDQITGAEVLNDTHFAGIKVTTTDGDIRISPNSGGMLKEDKVRPLIEFICERANIQETLENKQIKKTPDERIPENSGKYVTPERVNKISDILDHDEMVHYLTRGSTIDVEGSSAGKSLFGDDRSRKSGTKGYVRAAITDKRVTIKVPQWLGNDERSIPYQNITSVDLDTGFVNKRLSLQTAGQTYHIEVHEPGKKEVREALSFIRRKIAESNEQQVVVQSNDSPDPTKQIQNLKELHDEGVLTDQEFEEKKQTLLDKL